MKSITLPFRLFTLWCALGLMLTALQAATPEATPQLAAAVAKLEKLGLVDDAAYWLENARGNRPCDGARVGAVIVAAAKRQSKVRQPDLAAALEILRKRAVLTKTEYWSANAVEGKTCTGGQVASLLSRIAKTSK